MIIDVVLGILVIFGFIRGYSKGIIGTVFSLIAVLLGIVAALKLSPLFIGVVDKMLPQYPRLSYIIGFLLTFGIVMLLITFLGKKIEKVFKAIKLNFINKIAGGILTSLFFIVLYSFVLWFMNEARLISEQQKDQSITYYQLEPIPAVARNQFETLKPVFKGFWDKTIEVFDKAREKGEEIQMQNTGSEG